VTTIPPPGGSPPGASTRSSLMPTLTFRRAAGADKGELARDLVEGLPVWGELWATATPVP